MATFLDTWQDLGVVFTSEQEHDRAKYWFEKGAEATESPGPLGQAEFALLGAIKAAFIQGAKWWEYERTGATMWPGDQDRALAAAIKRAKNGTLGKIIAE